MTFAKSFPIGTIPTFAIGLLALAARGAGNAPPTTTVERWHVEYAKLEQGQWRAKIEAFAAKAHADSVAEDFRSHPEIACVRVTGPFQQEIPA